MKTETRVVNIRWDKYDIYIGRAGKGMDGFFGNPHVIGYCKICQRHHDREDAIEAFRQEFIAKINSDDFYKKSINLLRGKVLGCFCKPEACHGDVYTDYFEHPEKYLSLI